MHQWLQREKNFYQVGIHAVFQKWRKTVDRGRGYTETSNNYLIYHEIENRGINSDEPMY
jgi:hypothetical protein